MKYFVYCRKSQEAEERQALSLESQQTEAKRAFRNLHIVEVLFEAKSAKSPGRPIFNDMLERIKRGEADGIISWHPDRLARNSVDGGLIIYLLDQGALKDLKFSNHSFENTPQGKFMLQIMFGYSKYYVDSLSENVKRGMRAKVERGWFPAVPPIGYKNDRETNTIVRDPEHFEVVKRLLSLALTGAYTVRELCLIARKEWGYLTPKRKRMGGNPLSINTTYRILENVFYAGHFMWNGVMYKGKHEPIISLEDYHRLQGVIFRRGISRPVRNSFPYTGLMRCGACGLSITAERHTNRFGSKYVYYHCTKRRIERCMQPSVEARVLETQMVSFLKETAVLSSFEQWVRDEGLPAERESRISPEEVRASLSRMVAELEQQITNLTNLRIRDHIGDDEFLKRRHALALELKVTQEKLVNTVEDKDWFEPLMSLILFSTYALPWFVHGDDEMKRTIIKTVGSNPVLKDKKLIIGKAKPFVALGKTANRLQWSACLREVRTLIEKKDPETMKVIEAINTLVTARHLTFSLPRASTSLPELREGVDEEIADTG